MTIQILIDEEEFRALREENKRFRSKIDDLFEIRKRLIEKCDRLQVIVDKQREALEFYEYLHDDGFKARKALALTATDGEEK